MSLPLTAAEVLSKHVVLEIEGIDRMYLNVYIPDLQRELGVVGFFCFHRGYPFISAALMNPMTRGFVQRIEDFARDHQLPLEIQRCSHDCSVGESAFRQLQQPALFGGQRVPALRFGDPRTQATNGTDAPVEDVSPIASFYAAVSRRMKDGNLFFPEQRMSREQALRSYTMSNAYAAFEEDLKGSLAPGKLADVTVLSKDIMTVPEEQIPRTEVLYTIVAGKVVFAK